MGSVVHLPTKPGFPAPDPGDKKFNSRLVAPTIFLKKPFGENVEGLVCLKPKHFAACRAQFKEHATQPE